jgi:hypothetical protein
MQFGPCYFIFGMYILNITFSDTLSPYASRMVSDKVSHELFISVLYARPALYVGSAFNWPWHDL